MIIQPKFVAVAGILVALTVAGSGPVKAYSCKSEFNKAQTLIKEAEGLVKPDTDSRILALIEQAKGTASSGFVSHTKANQRHIGASGKFMHGQAVSKGRQAQAIAKQALFLLTGQTR